MSSSATMPPKTASDISVDNVYVTWTRACGRSGQDYYEIHVHGTQGVHDSIALSSKDDRCACRVILTKDEPLYLRALAAEGRDVRVSVSYQVGQRKGRSSALLVSIAVLR